MDMYGQRGYKDGIDSKMVRDQILISSIVSNCHIQAWDDSHCTPRDVHFHSTDCSTGMELLELPDSRVCMKNKGIAGIA